MKHKNIIQVFLVIVAGLFFVLWIIMYVYNKNLNDDNKTLMVSLSNNMIMNKQLSFAYLQSIKCDVSSMKLNLRSLDNKYQLNKAIKGPTLIFIFSQYSCHSCIERELRLIENIEERGIPILIVGIFPTHRELLSVLSDYKIKSSVIAITHEDLTMNYDDEWPDMFYALIDNDLNLENLFIPAQHNKALSEKYFSFIKEEINGFNAE